ncbi:NAD(P)/FAD-dependent oxidoreductase [Ignavibacteria bacterium]|nr:NAD(P)/FAD-dependent oxidoreductase [Bacteroidota bacterium]MCZ2133051.1 NAD(P)/FAD-dependent oxidoreductase [Bacteroidota bacterium]
MPLKQKYPRVVIAGAGFGGLNVAKTLIDSPFEVLLIDKTNHHLFQPLLYQVAAAALSPAEIAAPIRTIFRGVRNVQVEMDEAISVNPSQKILTLKSLGEISFDYLVLAPGSRHSYFGHSEWGADAPGLKTLDDALHIREKVLTSFEHAEHLRRKTETAKYLTFIVVGGGPTGVEIAGALAEIGKNTMLPDFPILKQSDIAIFLVEAGDRILSAFPPQLSEHARLSLESLGVRVMCNATVQDVKSDCVEIKRKSGATEQIATATIIWAAGNNASPLLQTFKAELDDNGRVLVRSDCSLPDHPDIFVIGDAANFKGSNGNPLPGLCPVAIQQGRYVGSVIKKRLSPENRKPFKYFDKGTMATIGRAKAVAVSAGISFTGFLAWFLWAFVHIYFLISFRNRLRVMVEWIWYYITFQPGARLIIQRMQRQSETR